MKVNLNQELSFYVKPLDRLLDGDEYEINPQVKEKLEQCFFHSFTMILKQIITI